MAADTPKYEPKFHAEVESVVIGDHPIVTINYRDRSESGQKQLLRTDVRLAITQIQLTQIRTTKANEADFCGSSV